MTVTATITEANGFHADPTGALEQTQNDNRDSINKDQETSPMAPATLTPPTATTATDSSSNPSTSAVKVRRVPESERRKGWRSNVIREIHQAHPELTPRQLLLVYNAAYPDDTMVLTTVTAALKNTQRLKRFDRNGAKPGRTGKPTQARNKTRGVVETAFADAVAADMMTVPLVANGAMPVNRVAGLLPVAPAPTATTGTPTTTGTPEPSLAEFRAVYAFLRSRGLKASLLADLFRVASAALVEAMVPTLVEMEQDRGECV